MKTLSLTVEQARSFYAVHRERPFFPGLIDSMTSGPVIILILEREDAINHYRKIMGATDPTKAEPGTIRQLFGTVMPNNAVHGSDSVITATIEISHFFAGYEFI
jgi:nucleoside-diphosphate kinase